jgi:hypothetical protein
MTRFLRNSIKQKPMFRKPFEGGDAEVVVAVSSGERMVVRRRSVLNMFGMKLH